MLRKIQAEYQISLETLLPIVAATIFRMNNLNHKVLLYCNPFVDTLWAGFDKSLGHSWTMRKAGWLPPSIIDITKVAKMKKK